MATHKNFDKVCCVVLALCLALTALFMNGESLGLQAAAREMGYESRLFDTASVHTIDIVMEDWEGFLETAQREEYSLCSLVIDGETYENVAIRGKGNTSLTQVEQYGNSRYSFKVEFDHYDNALNYYGLDKLSLNNLIQDNTMLKDYLCYQLMGSFGVDAPPVQLCVHHRKRRGLGPVPGGGGRGGILPPAQLRQRLWGAVQARQPKHGRRPGQRRGVLLGGLAAGSSRGNRRHPHRCGQPGYLPRRP